MSNTSYNPWLVIKAKMLDGLYTIQINYWNTELAKVIQKNAHHLGTVLSEASCRRAAIQYKNKSWRAMAINWLSDLEEPPDYHFPLFEGNPELEEKLEKITTEMAKIKRERYESDRFMSTLTIYSLSGNELHQILGENLYKLISKPADGLLRDDEEIFQPQPLESFLQMHSKILEHMQERVMVNLLMSDIVKQ